MKTEPNLNLKRKWESNDKKNKYSHTYKELDEIMDKRWNKYYKETSGTSTMYVSRVVCVNMWLLESSHDVDVVLGRWIIA